MNYEFGTKAVQRGFLTLQQLGECLKILAELEKQGRCLSFRELLVGRGSLTAEQAVAIEREKTVAPSKRRFGRYEIIAEVGSGGMGRVYRAYDSQLEREVALKVLLTGSMASEHDIERFYREVKLTAQLNHPWPGNRANVFASIFFSFPNHYLENNSCFSSSERYIIGLIHFLKLPSHCQKLTESLRIKKWPKYCSRGSATL